MTQHDSVRARLHAIEALLRQHQLWQETAPQPEAFASTQPFCLDTLAPFEWLQWVLIPRMHALLEGGHPLPQTFAVSPYYEMALEATHPARDVMLPELERLDALFAGDDACAVTAMTGVCCWCGSWCISSQARIPSIPGI